MKYGTVPTIDQKMVCHGLFLLENLEESILVITYQLKPIFSQGIFHVLIFLVAHIYNHSV